MRQFPNISLKNKIFFSILAVILIISIAIAFLARWILVSSLISELELRGIAIARNIAERGGSYILDKKHPQLLNLIFDEVQLSERRHLIAYIFILDQEHEVLSHTFTHPFPDKLRSANEVPLGKDKSVRTLIVGTQPAYDIAIPIKEGLYSIGTVHVGLNKNHIDNLVSKLRFTFLGFISLIIVIIFIISHKLSKSITMPISKLTRISNELSRGNFDIKLDVEKITKEWDPSHCPAYINTDLPCWHFDESLTSEESPENSPMRAWACQRCVFYRKRRGDEVIQLADSFHNMVWSIKLYRRRLRESEEKYRSLFDSGPDPIFVVDSSTFQIIDANPRALELYEYSKRELIRKSFLKLGSNHSKEWMAFFDHGVETGQYIYHPKVLHYKKGGKPFFVNIHACPISYGGKSAFIVAAIDVTEMMEKDAQLIQANKLKSLGEMSAGIAHELNQPLNAIKMGSEFLAMTVEQDLSLPKDQLHEVVTEISIQVDRAADIINNLRAFGRKAGLVMERIDINKPVRGVFSLVGKQFELGNIKIDLELSPNLPPILAHDNRLQQVFFNLVTNARDAINEKNAASGIDGEGIITIRSYEENNRVVVEVRDNGGGIHDSVKDKIFEPFFTTKETSHDMGLGLAITYGIVKDHDGEIQVRSREGEGTTFKLSFPAAA